MQVDPYYLLTGRLKESPANALSEDRRRLLAYYDLLTDFERGELTAELRIKTRGRGGTGPEQNDHEI